jgi:hypothetical protein
MLLHLPIAILVTLSPIAVSGSVPQFDIARECRFEGGSTATFERCSQDEAAALTQLTTEWAHFADTDQTTCMVATTTSGFANYVELLTCLEMARDVATPNPNPDNRHAKSESRPQARRSGVTVGEGHWH